MEFDAHLTGWVGEMVLRKSSPFKGWTQTQWEKYCAQGPYFLGKPHYELTTKTAFRRLVDRAQKFGWGLLARTTNHNGVCPAFLGNTAWMQETRWHFVHSERAAMIQISYTETSCDAHASTPAEKLKFSSHFEAEFAANVEDDGAFAFRQADCWRLNAGRMDDFIDGHLEHLTSDQSVDDLFSDKFWNAWNTVLPHFKKGKLSLLWSYWAGVYGLPGSQTEPQRLLSEEFELKYLQQLVRTPLRHRVKDFIFDGDHLSARAVSKTHLTENKQALIDRVWHFVHTGQVDPRGLHDCSKHATHCVCLGFQGGYPLYIPSNPGGNSRPWHEVFDMKRNLIGEGTPPITPLFS